MAEGLKKIKIVYDWRRSGGFTLCSIAGLEPCVSVGLRVNLL